MNKMKIFEDAILEPVLFGLDVIVTSDGALDPLGENDNADDLNKYLDNQG